MNYSETYRLSFAFLPLTFSWSHNIMSHKLLMSHNFTRHHSYIYIIKFILILYLNNSLESSYFILYLSSRIFIFRLKCKLHILSLTKIHSNPLTLLSFNWVIWFSNLFNLGILSNFIKKKIAVKKYFSHIKTNI